MAKLASPSYPNTRFGSVSTIAAEQGLGLAPTSVEEIPSGANVCVLRAADFSTYGEIHAICLKSRRRLPIIKEAFEQLSASEGGKEPG